MNLKKQIIQESLLLLKQDGLIFSIDDLSKRLKIGKAKIYSFFASKEVLARECYQYLYRLLKDKLSSASSLEDILSIYQTSLCYQQDSIFNRYSINHSIKSQAKELLSLIDEECFSSLQSDKKSIPSFRVLLEESLITYKRKNLPLSELIKIVL